MSIGVLHQVVALCEADDHVAAIGRAGVADKADHHWKPSVGDRLAAGLLRDEFGEFSTRAAFIGEGRISMGQRSTICRTFGSTNSPAAPRLAPWASASGGDMVIAPTISRTVRIVHVRGRVISATQA